MKNNRIEDGSNTQKSMMLNTISGIISILISFCTTILITRFISTSDLGIATSFINLKNIITLIAGFSIHYSLNRMMIEKYKNDYEYLSSIYISSILSMLFFFLIYILFHNFFNNIFGFSTKMMVLLFLMIICVNGANVLTTYFNFKNNYKVMFIYNLLCLPIAQISSLIFCYILTSKKYIGRIVGLESFSIIFGIIFGVIILIKGKFTFNKKYVKDSLKISVPMIPHLLSQILLSGCDLIMIKNIIGSSEAGVYGMSYSIASILFAILIQLFNPWSPWVYRRLKLNEIDSIKSNSKVLTVLCFYLCFGLFSVSPDMINLFLPDTYKESIMLVAPIAIGIYFQIMYLFFYDIEYYYKKNKEISLFSVLTAVINIVLNIICINKFGYKAAAFTTLVSYILLFIMHYLEMKHIEKRKIYDVKFIVLLSIILMLTAVIYHIFNYNIVVRYSILIIASIIIFLIYKNTAISFINVIMPNKVKFMKHNTKSKIYMRISGGLGNQMFEYATARAVQLEQIEKGINSKLYFTYEFYKTPKKHEKYKLDLLNISKEPIYSNSKKSFKFLLATFFFHWYLRVVSKSKNNSYKKFQKSIEWTGCYINTNGYYKIDSNKKNICLKGFFQSSKYFDKYKDIIIDELSVKSDVKNQELYKEILKNESVCIHVRRGDYVNTHLEVCTKEYYLKSINLLNKKYRNLKYYIFSDDISWCKENIHIDNVTYVEGNSAVEDLKLMYSCKYFIISNSTYSWWSQYLSTRVEVVIAPSRWSNDDRFKNSELYNDNWILIDI